MSLHVWRACDSAYYLLHKGVLPTGASRHTALLVSCSYRDNPAMRECLYMTVLSQPPASVVLTTPGRRSVRQYWQPTLTAQPGL